MVVGARRSSPEMAAMRRAFLLVGAWLLMAPFVQSVRPTEPRDLVVSPRDRGTSHLDDTSDYPCPIYCHCFTDSHGELWINCTVPYLTQDFETMTSDLHPDLTWGLIITCFTDRLAGGGVPMDSLLWDGMFRHLRRINLLFLENCSLRTLKSSSFAGLSSLDTLIIRGAHLEAMESDFIAHLPKLQELEISYSSVTRVFPLCDSTTLLTLNLTGNQLTSMEDTGLFCPRGSLTQLERLDVHNNFVAELPAWVSENLPKLNQLVVADNLIVESKPESFSYLPNLGVIDLSNNSFTAFHPRYFEGCKNILILGLSRNNVPLLPPGLLVNMSNILQLEVSEMGLDDRLWMELLDLHTLMHLNMSFNAVTSINADIMRQFVKLQSFYANDNRIRDIPSNAFEFQENLKILSLSHNEITRVPKLAFSERYALEEMYLDHNNISFMDAAAISGLEQLKTLNLSYNRIPHLPIGVFSRLHNLQTMDISSNNIRSFGHDVFTDTKLLEYFNASRNSFTEFPILNSMRYLKKVDLSHNNITSLHGNTFQGLRDLGVILLTGNNLKSLNNKIFKGCDSLRTLDLSHNYLEKLGDSTFSSTLQIESINLSHNDISSIGYIFAGLKNLKSLDLSYNKLTQILRGQFPNVLEFLNLKDNQISQISAYTFKSMHDIKLVDISANRLETLDKVNVEVAYRLHFQPTFILRYNPFVCDCRLGWLKDYADGRLEDNVPLPNFKIKQGLMCRPPFSKWATRIQSIDRSRFLCNYTSRCEDSCMCCEFDSCHCKYQCPKSCRCFIGDDVMHVHQVRCNSAQLTAVPLGLPEGATGLWMDGNDIQVVHKHAFLALKMVAELYLNNSQIHTIQNNSFIGLKSVRRLFLHDNFITAIYDVTFKGLENLEEVYLQNNDIFHVEPNSLIAPPFLVRVNLQGNDMNTISTRDLDLFVNRSAAATLRPQLHLGGNPWTCESDFSCRFLQFLLTNSGAIQDIDYIECMRPLVVEEAGKKESITPTGRLVLDLQQDLCAENVTTPPVNLTRPTVESVRAEPEMYALIAACVIATFVIILVVVCYLNRHFLQVFCFTRFGFRPFKMANADDDYERPYDAFISYSNKDEDFVIRQLAPRLEKGDKKFKLCVHYRDFPVGTCIAETIVRSVEASKRTILVVSDNFLDSEWCRFEFQTAHQQVLNERRNRVILVLMHDIDTDKLDNTLKAYMRTRTYLKYDDAWFWEKLMFSMPDVRFRKQQQQQEVTIPRPTTGPGSFRDVDFIVRDNAGRVSLMSQQQHQQQHQQQQQQLQQQQQQTPRTLTGYHFGAPTATATNGGVGVVPVNVPPPMVGMGVGIHPAAAAAHNHAAHHVPRLPPPGSNPNPNPNSNPNPMSNDMYEIPVLENQSAHYQLANGGVCCSPCPSSHHSHSHNHDHQHHLDHLDHDHTNTAFQPNYSDTTSGYHNGSCSSAHYEEVGPPATHFLPPLSHSTPHKQLIIDTPPPLPRIPQEGFIPRDRMTFV